MLNFFPHTANSISLPPGMVRPDGIFVRAVWGQEGLDSRRLLTTSKPPFHVFLKMVPVSSRAVVDEDAAGDTGLPPSHAL